MQFLKLDSLKRNTVFLFLFHMSFCWSHQKKKKQHIFDKLKSITLKVGLLFPITKLDMHINNAFREQKREMCVVEIRIY
jgi:hypothetical protein